MRYRTLLESRGIFLNRGILRGIRRKVVKLGVGVALTCGLIVAATNGLDHATSSVLTFKDNVVTSAKQVTVDKLVEDTANILEKADVSTEKGVEQLAGEISSKATTFANENGTVFQKASISKVVDGDTIVVDIYGDNCQDQSHLYKVRLIGVNTPESVASQEYLDQKGTTNSQAGKTASDYTKSLLQASEIVYLEADKDDKDKYGRSLYYVWFEVPENEYDIDVISTEMLNGILVKNGYAEVATYKPNVKYEDYFESIEESIQR